MQEPSSSAFERALSHLERNDVPATRRSLEAIIVETPDSVESQDEELKKDYQLRQAVALLTGWDIMGQVLMKPKVVVSAASNPTTVK